MADKGLIAKTTLQAIADAIREKTGETGSMLPSTMAAAIEAISTGAEFPASVKAVDVQEYVRTSDFTSGGLNFNHNLGETPDIVIMFRSLSSKPTSKEVMFALVVPYLLDNQVGTLFAVYDASSYSHLTDNYSNNTVTFAECFNEIKFLIGYFSTSAKLVAGSKYTVMAIKLA